MKTILRNGAGLLAAASLTLVPVQASAQAYDSSVYNLLLDCAAMQVLFAQASDKQEEKDKALNSAVGFVSGVKALTGSDIKDLAAEINPRKDKLLAMLDKKDGSLERMVRSCAAIERVGRDAIAAASAK